MPFPVHARFMLPSNVRGAADDFDQQLGGWSSKEHKDDGAHGDVTADSLALVGALTGTVATFSGDVTAKDGIFSANASVAGSLTAGATIFGRTSASLIGTNRDDFDVSNKTVLDFFSEDGFAPGGGFTGFSGGVAGRMLVIVYYDFSARGGGLTLAHENAGSVAANRIICPGAVDLTLAPDDIALLFYNGSQSRWRARLMA